MPEEPVREYSAKEIRATMTEAREYVHDDEVPDDVRIVMRHHLDNIDAACQQLRVLIGIED